MADNRYGEPVREIRKTHCPHCKSDGAEMMHLRFAGEDGEIDVRRCADCKGEVELETIVYAKPSEATIPLG